MIPIASARRSVTGYLLPCRIVSF
ncbi:hypothetical protein M3J09_002917 [Ascochyta lentis]